MGEVDGTGWWMLAEALSKQFAERGGIYTMTTKCTALGCRYDEVSVSLERMRSDFKTVQDSAIELAKEYNSEIARLKASIRAAQFAIACGGAASLVIERVTAALAGKDCE
jgi:hypothetical protein